VSALKLNSLRSSFFNVCASMQIIKNRVFEKVSFLSLDKLINV